MVFGMNSGGRSSALVSSADDRAALPDHRKHGSPLHALRRMGDRVKHHTAVTTTEEEPGVSSSDRAAGTAVPVAERARSDALNAGFQPPRPHDDGPRRSFSSFRSFRSRAGSVFGGGPPSNSGSPRPRGDGADAPTAEGTTSGQQSLSVGQAEADKVAKNPQKFLSNVGGGASAHARKDGGKDGREQRGPRLANTETTFERSQDQSDRSERVREHLQNEPHFADRGARDALGSPGAGTGNGAAEKGKSGDEKGIDDAEKGKPTEGDSGDGRPGNAMNGKSDDGVAENGTTSDGDSKYGKSTGANASLANGNANGSATKANGTASGQPRTDHIRASELPAESSGFADAQEPAKATSSQPSAQAAGSLSPRNRFIGHRGDSFVRADQGAGFRDAPGTPQSAPAPPGSLPFNGAPGTPNSAPNPQATLGTPLGIPGTPMGPQGTPMGPQDTPMGPPATPNGAASPSTLRSAAPSKPSGRAESTSTSTVAPTSSTVPASSRAPSRAPSQAPSHQPSQDDAAYEDDPDGDHPANADEDWAMPEGVPGLGFGDQDPLLPGERRKQRKKPATSPDNESEAAKKRFADNEQEVRRRRQRQAEYAGWRQIGGWDKRVRENTRQESEDLLARATMLESFVSDKYLGDWYQNTALIVFTAFAAWVMGRLHLSVSWISIVLLFTATAYRTSVRRMRRNYRDDILRQQLLDRQENDDTESMEWLNSFMIKFWLIYEPSLSQMITEIGNEVLEEQTPAFIHSMKIDKFTLGTKAPRIDFVRSFPRTNAQVVVIDMGVSFTPNDTMDLTARQLQTKVNPKVQLGVRIGKGFLTKNMPILLEDMNFKGKFRLRMKLMERAPHIQTVDFSFLAPPDFDFVLKPIGGDKLGLDINIIPGLSKFIKDMVNANLGPMFYAPNAFQINVEQLLAGVGVMSGVGVLSLQIIRAEELKRDADGRVDPYVLVRGKANTALTHTKIKNNTTEPVWNETLHVIVNNTNDSVLLEVFDFDDSSPDREIGQVPLRISDIAGSEVERAPITSGGRTQGYLTYVAHYAPVTMPTESDQADGTSPRDTKSGILNLKVTAARDLDPSVSKTAQLSPYAEIEFSGRLLDSTKVAKDTNDPEWGYSAEHIVMDKVSTLFAVRVRDNRSKLASAPQIGIFKSKLSQLLVESEKGRQWFPLGDDKGEIKIELQWKPANITIGGSTNNYVEPVGVLRVNIRNAKNLRNLEHLGKIDPYTRLFLGNRLVARTDWFKNELNPVWDEILYIPVESELQSLTMEVMDVEKHSKDRSLGAFKIDLDNIIKKDENDNYKVFVSDKTFVNKLMLPNRGPKGTLEYSLEFYPAIPVVSPDERERIQGDKKLIERLKKKISEAGGDANKALSDKERRELASREERLDFGGVDMPIEQQLTYEAGVFALAVVSLTGHRVGQSMRVFANNQPFPIYTSAPFKSSRRWTSETCPDFVSGQMHLSSVRIELGSFHCKHGLSGLDDINDDDADSEALKMATDPSAGELTVSCFELVREASLEPKEYKLLNGASIVLQARFFPLPGLLIDPSEDISNHGNIEIDLQKAVDVAAADHTGLSDPYAAFYVNNKSDRVYKSKTQKQTLNPVWNETFRFAVDDVKQGFVKAIINDWDMGNADDFLGGYKFEFHDLEPLVWKDYEVPLQYIKKNRDTHRKHKEVPGTLYLRMRFLPGMLLKEGDHFLLGADSVSRAAGGMVNAGASAAAGAAAGGVGSAVGTVAHAPQNLLHKFTHHGGDEGKDDPLLKTYFATIEEITGLNEIKHEIQVRCYLLGQNERELYRTSNIKLERGEATPNASFDFRALPGQELGIKVVTVKSLGRHSDVTQTSTELSPGSREVRLTKDGVLRLTLAEE